MSIKNKMKDFFGLEEDPNSTYEGDDYDVVETKTQPMTETIVKSEERPKTSNNIVALNTKKKERSKVVLAEPRVFAEAQDISDQLKENRAVIVNLQRMSKEQSRQVVNFLSGVVYALEGTMTSIGHNTILCTPNNIELTGSISNLISEEELNSKGW
ncbi:cell division protein SepF [Exiguobacterium sp. AM39-5BH]|uniref:cell division protein SepF n=1 Tax=Exiguobacterium sp. AM39-5BH TaxID=2292355 RepID=UPI000FE19CF5|nr:cell division protein SepF [Exiguobacterium sp. AM39-5BH]RHB51198.1 cell division protein SepF [Exiguobacterium sp. AM39-5BH]